MRTDGGATLSGAFTETGSTEVTLDSTVAASQTDSLIACAFDKDTLQSVFIVADRDCSLQTNSAGSPPTTIALKSGIALQWSASAAYHANPFAAADVTAFYLTTGAGGSTRLQARILNT